MKLRKYAAYLATTKGKFEENEGRRERKARRSKKVLEKAKRGEGRHRLRRRERMGE